MKISKSLEKVRKQHFDLLKKNNSLTDAKNGTLSLHAMKTLDILLQKYQETGETRFVLDLAELRRKLGLQKNNDYISRIKLYLNELKLPFEIRDFKEVKTGREIDWAISSFLHEAVVTKEAQNKVEIYISEILISYMIDKAGYTTIDLNIAKKYKSKFGYKIYELFLRYYSFKRKNDPIDVGYIAKTIDELNEKFGTSYKHASQLSRNIKRGTEEIYELTGVKIHFFYDKPKKSFIFTWEIEDKNEKCMIPTNRINELVDWIFDNSKVIIEDEQKYKDKISDLIKSGKYEKLEEKYTEMLMKKYTFTEEEVKGLKRKGKFKNFLKEKSLFN